MTKTNNNNNKQITETIKLKVPKKLQNEISMYDRRSHAAPGAPAPSRNEGGKVIGLTTQLPRLSGREGIHFMKGGITSESMILNGYCLLDVLETEGPTYFNPVAGSSGNTVLMYRRLVHPSMVLSERLEVLSKIFTKYKFRKFAVRYQTETNQTISGAVNVAYTKDFSADQPKPGVSMRAWMAELGAPEGTKVADSFHFPMPSTKGDLPSYWIGKGQTDINTVYQNQLLITGTGLASTSYYGDFYITYEIEFFNPAVRPINYDVGLNYAAFKGTGPIDNTLSWKTSDVSQVDFYLPRQGIYLCQLRMNTWIGFERSIEYSGRNNYGTSFFLSITATKTNSTFSTYDAILFTVYESMAAVLDDNQIEIDNTGGTTNFEDLRFTGQVVLETDSAAKVVSPITLSRRFSPKDQLPCTIGIGVGPGVLAGEPDVTPEIGFRNGRIVMGNPSRLRN